jgi:hypothetical protein
VVPADGCCGHLADAVDALGRPRVVADHVAGTDDSVDGGHVVEDRFERREVRVHVRDEPHLHRIEIRGRRPNRFGPCVVWVVVERGSVGAVIYK